MKTIWLGERYELLANVALEKTWLFQQITSAAANHKLSNAKVGYVKIKLTEADYYHCWFYNEQDGHHHSNTRHPLFESEDFDCPFREQTALSRFRHFLKQLDNGELVRMSTFTPFTDAAVSSQ